MAVNILRYEPRNGPPQWVLCMDGRVVHVSDRLSSIQEYLETDTDWRKDQDRPGA